MPQSMMDGYQSNISTCADNLLATGTPFSHQNISTRSRNISDRPGGIHYMLQTMPSLNTTSLMALRQQTDESNLEFVNNLTQQMGIIFRPMAE